MWRSTTQRIARLLRRRTIIDVFVLLVGCILSLSLISLAKTLQNQYFVPMGSNIGPTSVKLAVFGILSIVASVFFAGSFVRRAERMLAVAIVIAGFFIVLVIAGNCLPSPG